MNRDVLELVFKHSGGVELRAVTSDAGDLDTVIWASDSDQDFMDSYGQEIFDAKEEGMIEGMLEWLVDHDVIDDDEADDLRIVEESLDGRDIVDGDIDPDEEEDDDDYDEGAQHASA